MATLLQPRPVLWVAGVPASAARHVNIPGFTDTVYRDDPKRGAEAEKAGVAIRFAKPAARLPGNGPQPTGILYVLTNDAEALWRVVEAAPQVRSGLGTLECGVKEFALDDCNGYILRSGQDGQA